MSTKVCLYCDKEFLLKRNDNKTFCTSWCQARHYYRRPKILEKYRIRAREYRRTHPEWREKHRLQWVKHKEKRQAYQKEYLARPEVRAKVREKERWKLKNDLEYAIADRLRRSLHHAMTKYSKTGKIISSRKYGIDWKQVIDSLKPFPEEVRNFEIDHIRPLHTFDLGDIEQVRLAFAPQNLQWLTVKENRSKGGKYAVNTLGKKDL